MKTLIKISLILSFVAFFTSSPLNAQCKDKDKTSKMDKMEKMHKMEMKSKVDFVAIDKNNDGKIYGCAMCGNFSDEPGKCPDCGMDYKELTKDDLEKHAEMHMEKGKMDKHAKCKYDKNNDGKVYQCPMHPTEISDKPENCKVCGMHLKEVPNAEAKEKLMKAMKNNK
jgi:hypothetical protein